MRIVRMTPLILALFTFSAYGNDYPTLERVDSVLTCMAKHGGQTVENLYSCSCKIDVIASEVPFDLWNEARTYKAYKRMPGEKGGLFRDSTRADEIVPLLEAAEKKGEKRCFVGVRHQKSKKVSAAK